MMLRQSRLRSVSLAISPSAPASSTPGRGRLPTITKVIQARSFCGSQGSRSGRFKGPVESGGACAWRRPASSGRAQVSPSRHGRNDWSAGAGALSWRRVAINRAAADAPRGDLRCRHRLLPLAAPQCFFGVSGCCAAARRYSPGEREPVASLVEERLKEVVVAAVNERYVNGRTVSGRAQPTGQRSTSPTITTRCGAAPMISTLARKSPRIQGLISRKPGAGPGRGNIDARGTMLKPRVRWIQAASPRRAIALEWQNNALLVSSML